MLYNFFFIINPKSYKFFYEKVLIIKSTYVYLIHNHTQPLIITNLTRRFKVWPNMEW